MLRNPSEDAVYFEDCLCEAETRKAILVDIPDVGKTWVPKSQVHDDSEVVVKGDRGTLAVTEWFAQERNLPR